MQTVAVAEVLAAEGLAPPVLNVLVPNEQNYSALLLRPQGDIEISEASVRSSKPPLAFSRLSTRRKPPRRPSKTGYSSIRAGCYFLKSRDATRADLYGCHQSPEAEPIAGLQMCRDC